MMRKRGKLLMPEDFKGLNDPNAYPPVVLFKYRKEFKRPRLDEGFESITELLFLRKKNPKHVNSANIFDYDGTLRTTKSGAKWPSDPDDVILLPGRSLLSRVYLWRHLGVSNQSAISKKSEPLTDAIAVKCFNRTNELLGVDIEYAYCPHSVPPITCWCRKPLPGLGVFFIEKYNLDPSNCLVIGDMTSDKTFATRCGFKYINAEYFFSH